MPLPNLEAALELASLGYGVFALNGHGKPYPNCQPCRDAHDTAELYETCLCLMCHGCYAATEDVERLICMWDEEPDSLVGIRTGRFSGIFVLDYDEHGGHNGINTFVQQRLNRLIISTVTARTPRSGLHLYYRYPDDMTIRNNNTGHAGAGVDVKSDGGYVIAPPSIKQGGETGYSWARSPAEQALANCPPRMLAKIGQSRTSFQERLAGFAVDLSKLDEAWFRDILERLEYIGEGSRNTMLYQAACRGGEAVCGGTIKLSQVKEMLTEKGQQMGLRRNEINATIRSGIARGMQDYREEIQ